jgi:hypothetical protein
MILLMIMVIWYNFILDVFGTKEGLKTRNIIEIIIIIHRKNITLNRRPTSNE